MTTKTIMRQSFGQVGHCSSTVRASKKSGRSVSGGCHDATPSRRQAGFKGCPWHKTKHMSSRTAASQLANDQAVKTVPKKADVVVREAKPEDSEKMGLIQQECGGFWNAKDLETQMGEENRLLMVAESLDNLEVLGMVLIWLVADEVQLMEVAVTKLHQGKGIGSALLEKALPIGTRYVKEGAGCGAAVLEVETKNLPAIALYQKFGFQEVGLRAGYYPNGADALLMNLPIE